MAAYFACFVECDSCPPDNRSFAIVKGRARQSMFSTPFGAPACAVVPIEPPEGWQEDTKLTSIYTCKACRERRAGRV